MNLPLDTYPTPLEPQATLSFDDVAPFLRLGSTNTNPINYSHEQAHDKVISPSKHDILCGREKTSYGHIGNKRFRAIIADNFERYQSCRTRSGKSIITDEIIKIIRNHGGRFLRKDTSSDLYVDVGHDYAHEKVSHALRSAKPKTTKPRKRKERYVRKPPTQQENEAFEFIYREQQRIFQELLYEQSPYDSLGGTAWQTTDRVIGI